MLYRYQPSEVALVRNKFENNSLYNIISNVCSPLTKEMPNFHLFSEQVFAEVVSILDDVKERQEEFPTKILWERIYNDYMAVGNGVPDEEIKYATAVVLSSVYAALMCSSYQLHHLQAQKIIMQVYHNRMNEVATNLAHAYDNHRAALLAWMREYIDSDEWLSEEVPNGSQNGCSTLTDYSNAIPEDCRQAAQNIFTPCYKVDQSSVTSSSRFRDVAQNYTLDKPATLAYLLAISKEVKCVKFDTGVTDFVKAVIGLGLLAFTSEEDIKKKSDAITHKINGEKSKKILPLSPNHKNWPTKDQKIGNGMYEAFMKP